MKNWHTQSLATRTKSKKINIYIHANFSSSSSSILSFASNRLYFFNLCSVMGSIIAPFKSVGGLKATYVFPAAISLSSMLIHAHLRVKTWLKWQILAHESFKGNCKRQQFRLEKTNSPWKETIGSTLWWSCPLAVHVGLLCCGKLAKMIFQKTN